MSFCFNFSLDEGEENSNHEELQNKDKENQSDQANDDKQKLSGQSQWAAEVVQFYEDSLISKLQTKAMEFNDVLLMVVDTSHLETLMLNDADFKSIVGEHTSLCDILTHSDLVSQVYEGGLKVWECGVDLAKFLSSHSLGSILEISDKCVLELGCGAGLPGLYCVKKGANVVDFQDYNIEVLKLLTHSNVQMIEEVEDRPLQTKCRYYFGDWVEFCGLEVNGGEKYDLILSAETIYNVDNYSKLHTVFDQMLTSNGVILVAAKDYYFGVGGGIDSFIEFVNAQKCFDYETVWETKSGVPRKILMLRRLEKEKAGLEVIKADEK